MGSPRIEDYALIGDTQTAALVSREGSIDWLCLPRFDSDACFAALLGDERHGCWRVVPTSPVLRTVRRYRPGTLVLETELHTADGAFRITDCMPPRQRTPDLVRVFEGLTGRVVVTSELRVRLGYGEVEPWIRRDGDHLIAVGGPDAVALTPAGDAVVDDGTIRTQLELGPGTRHAFVLNWHPSHEPTPPAPNFDGVVDDTAAWWREWVGRCNTVGRWTDAVRTSLLVLKALTYLPTGGIVAAPTTSLPEAIRGVRNWDYRFCWIRDATFTLYALLESGFVDEARAFCDWLLRAVAGNPGRLQMLYGVAGERHVPERVLPWLPGYERSSPVRVGNAASNQFQLDVYGELMDTLHQARRRGLWATPSPGSDDASSRDATWRLQRALLDALEQRWLEPDEGIWEIRGPSRHFTHSKVMAWVAVDRAVQTAETFGLNGPVSRWKTLRAQIHDEVCARGYDARRGVFTQSYDSAELDSSLLMIPLVGFLSPSDERVRRTVHAIRDELTHDGLVLRYHPRCQLDGLPPREGAFLACSFWLCDCLALLGERDEARERFEGLLALRNDLGLLAEEYAPHARRQLGNFPQALSHLALVNTARNLAAARGPATERRVRTGGARAAGVRD